MLGGSKAARLERPQNNNDFTASYTPVTPFGIPKITGLLGLFLLFSSCGGGGGGSSGAPPTPPAPSPPSGAPPPPASSAPPSTAPPSSTPNRPPVVVVAPLTKVEGITGHELRYDASQGGTTFRDPDGDQLTYSVSIPARNLAATGPLIVYTPSFPEAVGGVIVASDGRGGEATHVFTIFVEANSPPRVVKPNAAILTSVGAHVNHDLTQAGTTFVDGDGDTLTYAVEAISPPGRGIDVVGVRATGALTNESIAAFKITASDGYGGSGADTLIIAAPVPLPGRPTLPAQSFAYADEDVPLPLLFRLSRTTLSPFWDSAVTRGMPNPPTNAGATLGRVLFYDKRLSVLNTHACASCHEQENGFTTNERFPIGVLGVPLKRNALALANVRYNLVERWFVDERALELKQLVLQPIVDPTELGNSLPMALAKLAATDFYPPLFEAAFGTREITADRVATALTQFLHALISYRSRFDQAYLQADEHSPPPAPEQVLTSLELQGEQLFNDLRFSCFRCHETAIQTMQVIGNNGNNGLDPVRTDPGADGKFRVASLRNIAASAPYMHDGRFATLREVIDHYDHGIQDSPDLSFILVDVSGPRRMNFTEAEKAALEAFLRTLTDDALLADPRFSDPFQ